MKVHVDCSVSLIDGTAFGVISGELDLPVAPAVGNIILLNEAPGVPRPVVADRRFLGHLEIETVMYRPTFIPGIGVLLSLKPIVLTSVSDARSVIQYLEEGFGLFGDEFGDAEPRA
jgi:hypothetical protein